MLERARSRLARSSTQLSMDRLRKALCDPARLQIVEALIAGEICVTDLSLAIGRAPAATSQHLRVLRNMGIVEARRQCTTMYYRLANGQAAQHLESVLGTLGNLAVRQSA